MLTVDSATHRLCVDRDKSFLLVHTDKKKQLIGLVNFGVHCKGFFLLLLFLTRVISPFSGICKNKRGDVDGQSKLNKL